jgi:putative spermidine/putrescine transport system substrate-binding protein
MINALNKFTKAMIAGGAVLASTAVFSTSASAEEKLVFMNWGGTWMDYAKRTIIEPFEKETGIKVEVRTHQNTMDGLAKLKANKDNLDVDIWATSPIPALIGVDEGVVAKLDPSKIPNAAKLPKDLVTPACVAWYTFFFGSVYNDKTSPVKIQKWDDLFDPKLKGQIAVPNASNAEGKFLFLLNKLEGGPDDDASKGLDKAKQLKPNAGIFYNSYTERDKALAAGEVSVGAMSMIGEYLDLAKDNPQFKFVAPEPFVPADFDCLAVTTGKNQEAAYKFIDFALSKAAQEGFANAALVVPSNPDAQIPAKLKDYAPNNSKLRYPNSAVMKEHLQAWTDKWNQEVQTAQ